MTHHDGCALVLLALADLNCMVAPRVVGLLFDTRGTPRKLGIPGEADIQGICPPNGIGIAVEVKVGKDKVKKHQREWAEAFISRGGRYAVCHPEKDGWKEQLKELVCK